MKKTIQVIKFLIAEIEDEIVYREKYIKAKDEAEKKANEYNKAKKPDEYKKSYWSYLEISEPKKSCINDNLKKIRQLCLKIYQ